MNCFPCFQTKESAGGNGDGTNDNLPVARPKDPTPRHEENHQKEEQLIVVAENHSCSTKNFTFRELAMATKNFRKESLLGEGGFGRVYKGTLQAGGKVVAVRQLDKNGVLESVEFVAEVANFNLLEHPNLVRLVGYCADGDQRLLVYEFMAKGSLKDHLYELPEVGEALDWNTRMKIASGIAEGLEYLHEKINPSIIYRDLKPSNILLDEANNAHLSKYGLANLAQGNNKMNVSPRLMASYGYYAPEYEGNGELTAKSDVYSFGVVLLELISGRKAYDPTLPEEEQNLVTWAQLIFRDQTKFPDLADPLLRQGYPSTSLNQAVGVAAMCLQEEPLARPLISDILAALTFLATAPPVPAVPAAPVLSSRQNSGSQCSRRQQQTSDSDSESNWPGNSSSSDYEYGDSSDNSDNDDGVSRTAQEFNECKKMNTSASKRRSKKQHPLVDNLGRSRRRNSSRPRSKSKMSRNQRCESQSFPGMNSNPIE